MGAGTKGEGEEEGESGRGIWTNISSCFTFDKFNLILCEVYWQNVLRALRGERCYAAKTRDRGGTGAETETRHLNVRITELRGLYMPRFTL